MANLIYKNLECVFYIQRGTKGARDLLKRIDLTVRALDLIIGHVGAALPGLSHVDLSEPQRFVSKARCRLLLQTKCDDLFLESPSMLEEHLDHVWIEVNS